MGKRVDGKKEQKVTYKMDTKQKLKIIQQALQTGEVSHRDIDIADCRATGKILAGQTVQNKVIERLYAALLKHREQKRQQKVDNKAGITRLCKQYGFSLTRRRGGGSRELYYYAGKRLSGKLSWVYLGKELRHSEAEVIELLRSVEKRDRQGELFGDYAELEEHYAKLVGLFRSIGRQVQDISRLVDSAGIVQTGYDAAEVERVVAEVERRINLLLK